MPPMVNVKQEIYVEIIKSLPQGDSDIAGFVNSTLRSALKMKIEPQKEKKCFLPTFLFW